MFRRFAFLVSLVTLCVAVNAQEIRVSGFVRDQSTGTGVPLAKLFFTKGLACICDSKGYFACAVAKGKHTLIVEAEGHHAKVVELEIDEKTQEISIELEQPVHQLAAVTITGTQEPLSDVGLQLLTVDTRIYAGKKNEIINLNNLAANTAINNSRQLYSKVPGINIIENDQAGVQLSIATRGLNPNRTTEFNSRQNGYDISADPIGYPETYYSPPSDGLDNIEIIRGAASLQYGTQFGGLLNFNFKHGPTDKAMECVSKQTVGSYGFFNSFNSLGGQSAKLNYYGFYNYKTSTGWRDKTGFGIHNGYMSLKYALTPKLTLGLDYSFMYYQAQQPGGLTDAEFKNMPRQSLRNRNWFAATWNIPALTLLHNINPRNLVSVKIYSLQGNRKNVGNLNPIIYADDLSAPRTVMNDEYHNYYLESRYMHHYYLKDSIRSSLLAGIRFYHGNTHRTQGYNYTGSDANFTMRNSDDLQIDYRFPSYNIAIFAENVFQLSQRFSITPGVRIEYIQTNANGYTIADTTVGIRNTGKETHTRKFPLLGIGLDYKISSKTDVYTNFSQNYSPVNFGDIIILQPGMKVDPDLKDVRGYNLDAGYRGRFKNIFTFDVGGFYLLYKNRVGTSLQTDGGGNIYQYKTNISDSRSTGAELYGEVNLWHILRRFRFSEEKLSVFASVAYTDARYINVPSTRRQFENKKVEYAPPWIKRYGLDFSFRNIRGSVQYSSTSQEFSEATNARTSNDGTTGIIPAYHVMDLTIGYSFSKWKLSLSLNNLTNESYFTRRTTGFPGPGIIPSQGRAVYCTLQFKI